ncbi:hypothetical protein WJX84_002351 [Apatococcus fuscideae]|uniref:Ribosomal protein S11 n=1 Tax=Apatococcus fuscideae TaxID=2026836 RepID=A0AAW1TKP5_9CHLO
MANFGRFVQTWLRQGHAESTTLACLHATSRSVSRSENLPVCSSLIFRPFATAPPQRSMPPSSPTQAPKIPGPRIPGLRPSSSSHQGPVLRRRELYGTVYIQSSSNNTILTLTDRQGNPKATVSCGSLGFKNARKSSTYAAEAAATQLAQKALSIGFARVKLKVKGIGFGKQAAVRALGKAGLRMSSIEDVTPFPHNGCRPPKKRVV